VWIQQDGPVAARSVEWVVLDLGETLVDETSNWGRWADYLGVPRLTFFAVLGAVIADGRPHLEVFNMFRPTFDFDSECKAKAAAGLPWRITADDLYPDALPTIERLRRDGYRIAVMANQPLEAVPFMATLPVDLVATSAEWGVAKPDGQFFARVVDAVGTVAARIAYVGDRLDNDVLPARRAGMVGIHLRRGPWGHLQASWAEASEADIRLDDLTALPDSLARLVSHGR
jgi:FMN phosphatase YigB (HAD superfamily)